MPEQGDTGFKITDRRKFNPDGTPREASEPETSEAPADAKPRRPEEQSNVVSFPTEPAKSEPRPSASRQEPPTSARAQAAQTVAGQAEQAYNEARGPSASGLPEPSFLNLVNMLGVEAAMHLGLIKTPGEEQPPVDLESAHHLIDMLGMLQTKTRGNLTPEEDSLLENALADLRMQFVAVSRRR
ncbi:MAG TPA: DUF1844 domain-containing protein [Blastocatellia bacterium]